jgi:hypothetical protein
MIRIVIKASGRMKLLRGRSPSCMLVCRNELYTEIKKLRIKKKSTIIQPSWKGFGVMRRMTADLWFKNTLMQE